MANPEHVEKLLRDGVEAWNWWRKEGAYIFSLRNRVDLREANLRGANLSRADLSRADLSGADLSGANLSRADLSRADLSNADLIEARLIQASLTDANLSRADLSRADLSGAYFGGADLSGADLSGAVLFEANLSGANLNGARVTLAHLNRARLNEADLSGADLSGADLREVNCIRTDFSGATLTDCNVYGISAWDLNLEGTVQADLRISAEESESNITVDNLEVAQFLYLLLHNEKMRSVIDTITSKVVLILGRFSNERKPILDALREALRRHPNGYIPVLFDFEPQAERHVLDTVKTLANLARFVIADVTDAHVVRTELALIIPTLPAVPVQPIVQRDAALPLEYTWWRDYKSVLPVYDYADLEDLLANLTESVITPVEAHVEARKL